MVFLLALLTTKPELFAKIRDIIDRYCLSIEIDKKDKMIYSVDFRCLRDAVVNFINIKGGKKYMQQNFSNEWSVDFWKLNIMAGDKR